MGLGENEKEKGKRISIPFSFFVMPCCYLFLPPFFFPPPFFAIRILPPLI
jgi:hypothetical protein